MMYYVIKSISANIKIKQNRRLSITKAVYLLFSILHCFPSSSHWSSLDVKNSVLVVFRFSLFLFLVSQMYVCVFLHSFFVGYAFLQCVHLFFLSIFLLFYLISCSVIAFFNYQVSFFVAYLIDADGIFATLTGLHSEISLCSNMAK